MANYDEEKYAVDYEDERFDKVTSAEEDALAKNEQLFADRENTVANLYDKQAEQVQQWADTQTQLQQQQTDLTIEQIEQQKDKAHKDYLKEQSGAYVDWRKQSNEYGTEAEKMASAGLTNTGFSESSQVSMYNTYQNRIATARASFDQAVLNYNNSIKEAKLQNNSVLAEIAATAMEKSIELTIQGAIYKDNLLQQKADRELQLKQFYSNEYQKVLDQINLENNRQFQADQAQLDREHTSSENALNREFQAKEAELDRQHETKQAEINRQFQAKQAELERKHDKEMLAAQTKAEKELLDKKHAQEMAKLEQQAEYEKQQADLELANQKKLLKYQYDLQKESQRATLTKPTTSSYSGGNNSVNRKYGTTIEQVESKGYTGSDFNSAVAYLKSHGASNMVAGLLTMSEWSRRRTSYKTYGTGSVAIQRFDNYGDYVRNYVQYATS